MRHAKPSILLATLLAVICAPSLACDPPLLVGTLTNPTESTIQFLSSDDHCPGNTHLDAVGVSSNGATRLGCWTGDRDMLKIDWDDGSTFVSPVEQTKLSPEWEAFDECLQSTEFY